MRSVAARSRSPVAWGTRRPAEREQFERDRRRGVCPLECRAEVARFVQVAERKRGKADTAERRDQSPAMVALGKGLVAGAPEPQGFGVVAQPERAQARAAERVARSPGSPRDVNRSLASMCSRSASP